MAVAYMVAPATCRDFFSSLPAQAVVVGSRADQRTRPGRDDESCGQDKQVDASVSCRLYPVDPESISISLL